MNRKHLSTLEYPKILHALSTYTSFSAGRDMALAVEPASDCEEIEQGLETTGEARTLLDERPGTSVGGAHDVRPLTADAERGKVLPPGDLLDVRDTLAAGRRLYRTLNRLESRYPHLARLAGGIRPCQDLIEEIDRCIDDQGGVRDEASPALARIRREVDIAYDRIQAKLEGIIQSSQNASYLQEPIITRREGRYVVPLKAQFKDKIPGVIHDRSSSGVTLFIEPLSAVDLNNAWRELQLEEEEEVRRILAALSYQIGEHAQEIGATVEALAALDVAFAKAKYADAIDASKPKLVAFQRRTEEHPGSTIRLLGARHPLLVPQEVVPIDVELDDETHVLVITGPNTGGKTVSLKTVGLLTLMAQAGLHIPVEPGSALSPFEGVYADIGDEQSIEQNLSTFSAHVTNIISFLDQADSRSLVLLDELGAGTDPAEGSALARALLEHFRRRRSTTFVATHYPELKTYAQLTPGVRNASVEFDPKTLSPTYRLTIGLPGRSNALTIARRLNMPREIIEEARKMISPEDLRTQDMLDDIHRLRVEMAREREEAHAARAEAKQVARELRERLAAIEEERQEILHRARKDAEEALEAVQGEIRQLRSRLRAAAAPVDAVQAVEEELPSLKAKMPAPKPIESPAPPPVDSPSEETIDRPVRPGDTVWVRPLNSKGEVLRIDDGEAEVQVGRARTQVSLSALELREAETPEPVGEGVRVSTATPESPGTSVDLRGCTVDESLSRLDHYLDQAMRAGLPEARIIHGKGTGTLRRAVRDFVADHPLVSDYEEADYREGGEGVTVVRIVKR
ncbi:MAG: endonuclease MutS2 [Chloroflexota bacterium]|nr:endonuclease MutS2 [Chloroflexota bacterium]